MFFKKVSFTLLTRVAGAIAVLLMNIVVTRSLGAERAGYFLLSVTFIMFWGNLLRFGTDNNLIKQLGRIDSATDKSTIKACFSSAFYIITLMLSAFTVVALIKSRFFSAYLYNDPQKTYLIPVVCLMVAVFSYVNFNSFSLIATGRTPAGVFIKNLFPYILFLGLFSLLVFFVGTENIIIYGYAGGLYVFLLALFLVMLFSFWFVSREGLLSFRCNSKTFQYFFISSIPLFFISFMEQVILFSGQLISAHWLNSVDIAFLASAQRASMMISFVLMSVNLVFGPIFSRLYYDQQFVRLKKMFLKSFLILIAISLPLFILIFVNAGLIMNIFGKEFVSSASIFRILLIGQFVNVCTGPVTLMMIAVNNEKILGVIVTFCGILSIILTIFLTSKYFIFGSAIAIAISVAAQNILVLSIVIKVLNKLTKRTSEAKV